MRWKASMSGLRNRIPVDHSPRNWRLNHTKATANHAAPSGNKYRHEGVPASGSHGNIQVAPLIGAQMGGTGIALCANRIIRQESPRHTKNVNLAAERIFWPMILGP